GPGVAAVEGPGGAVGEDLHQQDGDEVLVGRVRVTRGGGRLPRPGAGAAGHRPLQPAQHSGQVPLVVRRLAEAAEDGGGGPGGVGSVSAHVADDGAHAVFGGDHLVQVAADAGRGVGGQL